LKAGRQHLVVGSCGIAAGDVALAAGGEIIEPAGEVVSAASWEAAPCNVRWWSHLTARWWQK